METRKNRCISVDDGPCTRLAAPGKNYCSRHLPQGRVKRGPSIMKASAKKTAARRAVKKNAG